MLRLEHGHLPSVTESFVQTSQPEFEVDDAIVLLLGSDTSGRESSGEIRGITRLEKLVFLLERETDAARYLTEKPDFEAYNFGPFSRAVYQAVDTLASAGLITDSARLSETADDSLEAESAIGESDMVTDYSTRDFALTALGREYYSALVGDLPATLVNQTAGLRAKFAGWSLRRLVRYVYERYDEYTKNSLIRDDILGPGSR